MAAVSLRDGWEPSMCSQMGVSASGQYVRIGLESNHLSLAIEINGYDETTTTTLVPQNDDEDCLYMILHQRPCVF